MKDKIPLVRYDSVVGEGVDIGTPKWDGWLGQQNSFRYECTDASFTARKRGLYWTAFKKFKGVLRSVYLGKSEDLTYEKLEATAKLLSMSDANYQSLKESYVKEDCITDIPNSPEAVKELSKNYDELVDAVAELIRQVESKSKGFTSNSCAGGIKSILQLKQFLKTDEQ